MNRVEKERRRKIDQDNTILLNKMIKILNVSLVVEQTELIVLFVDCAEEIKQRARTGAAFKSSSHVCHALQ